jgi:hypothetical protein
VTYHRWICADVYSLVMTVCSLFIDVSLVPQQNILKAPKEHIQDILKIIEVTRKITRENLQMVRDERKEKHDQRASDIKFKRGQYVDECSLCVSQFLIM